MGLVQLVVLAVKVSVCPVAIIGGMDVILTVGVRLGSMLTSMVSGFDVQPFSIAVTMYFPESLKITLVLVGFANAELYVNGPAH